MRDIMIDIETLGTRPGSVILSIGAVEFDAEMGLFRDGHEGEFYASIDLESSLNSGLTIDADTLLWWLKQSEEARSAAFNCGHYLAKALHDLEQWVLDACADRIWAKPPSFDLVLLEAAMRAVKVDIPWDFRACRDCRTLFDIANVKQPDVGTAHNALDDAKSQALGVIEAYKALGLSKTTAKTAPPADWSGVTGILRDARVVNMVGWKYISGRVYNDVRKRFADGEWIGTSALTGREGDVFVTRNSRYAVESWAEGETGEVAL